MNTDKARNFLDYAQSVVEHTKAHECLIKMLNGWDVFIENGLLSSGESYYKVNDPQQFLSKALEIVNHFCDNEYNRNQANVRFAEVK